ncbi:hypothetical protein K438DRAFT_1782982 [Mycena galopus ATCC 62051]|nr:hypothetical protein K438DRAFT_1782982 [Mycena galopus ATCC 62051]
MNALSYLDVSFPLNFCFLDCGLVRARSTNLQDTNNRQRQRGYTVRNGVWVAAATAWRVFATTMVYPRILSTISGDAGYMTDIQMTMENTVPSEFAKAELRSSRIGGLKRVADGMLGRLDLYGGEQQEEQQQGQIKSKSKSVRTRDGVLLLMYNCGYGHTHLGRSQDGVSEVIWVASLFMHRRRSIISRQPHEKQGDGSPYSGGGAGGDSATKSLDERVVDFSDPTTIEDLEAAFGGSATLEVESQEFEASQVQQEPSEIRDDAGLELAQVKLKMLWSLGKLSGNIYRLEWKAHPRPPAPPLSPSSPRTRRARYRMRELQRALRFIRWREILNDTVGETKVRRRMVFITVTNSLGLAISTVTDKRAIQE